MILAVDIVLGLGAVALLVPSLVLFLECVLGVLPRRVAGLAPGGARPAIAVLIPAHNEEQTIGETIRSVRSQLGPGDRLVVIADNCTDETAAVARRAGATVVARDDPTRIGKGHALNQGLTFLGQDPPEVVLMVDADCTVTPGAVDTLARVASQSGRPVQARYTVEPPQDPDHLARLSAFAFAVKNVARPSGLHRLGLPCPLMGTGMAFPWSVIANARFDGGNITEDLLLGLDLTLAGHSPRYCFEAHVTSRLPTRLAAATTQRRRWEHGHLAILIDYAPWLLCQAVWHRRADLLAAALDLCVPPISLLVLVISAWMAGALLAAAAGAAWTPVGLLALSGVLLFIALAAAWRRFGATLAPLDALVTSPSYLAWKVPLYWDFVLRRQRRWVRTERGGDP